jgi:endonuclease YncB( thermonuclease family)
MKGMVRSRERKPVSSLLILMALALGGPPTGFPEATADSIAFTGVVVGIEDGDTLTVLRNKARFTLNLAGVDAPELDQPYGQAAKRLVAVLAMDQVVTVRVFVTGGQGRLTGEVWLKDRRNLANELVKAGLAWVKRGALVAVDLNQIEIDAKEVQRGLWRDEEPVPPWEWRNGRRK